MTEPRRMEVIRDQMKASLVRCCEAGKVAYPSGCPYHGGPIPGGFRIIVTGGRHYTDAEYIFAALDRVHRWGRIAYLAQGEATGADMLAKRWALRNGIVVGKFTANWERECDERCKHRPRSRNGQRYCPVAGIYRNQEMYDAAHADVVVAFPGGTGTSSMKSISLRHGTPIIEFSGVLEGGVVACRILPESDAPIFSAL